MVSANMVNDNFTNCLNVARLSETLITLISKVEPTVNLRQFKPINLCNVSYKVISKVLASILKAMYD